MFGFPEAGQRRSAAAKSYAAQGIRASCVLAFIPPLLLLARFDSLRKRI